MKSLLISIVSANLGGRRLDVCDSPVVITPKDYTQASGYTALSYWQNEGTANVVSPPNTPVLSDFIGVTNPGSCALSNCIITAASSVACTSDAVSYFTASLSGSNINLSINTSVMRAQAYYCLRCLTNDAGQFAKYSQPF